MIRRIKSVPLFFAMVAFSALLLAGSRAGAMSYGVRDQAHFFSSEAIAQANQIIQQINQKHHKDLLIETFAGIPQDMQADYERMGKGPFYEQWAQKRAVDQGVDGVYVLVTRGPSHLQAEVGSNTQQRLFTQGNRNQLVREMLPSFGKKQFDEGLLQGVRYVRQTMDANDTSSRGSSTAQPSYVPPTNVPSGRGNSAPPRGNWGIGSLACTIVAVVLFIVLLRGIFGRTGGRPYGGGGGYYPPAGGGAYPSGGYPPPGGYGQGGGGGGFGRGFLGGLLGGALGGYAAEKWTEHNQPQGGGYAPPSGGAGGGGDFGSGVDTSFSGTGGDFAPPDSGAGGADFGGGGGGGDFGGGGGGDAGSSGGGDF